MLQSGSLETSSAFQRSSIAAIRAARSAISWGEVLSAEDAERGEAMPECSRSNQRCCIDPDGEPRGGASHPRYRDRRCFSLPRPAMRPRSLIKPQIRRASSKRSMHGWAVAAISPRPIQPRSRYRHRRCYGHPVTRRAAAAPRIATAKEVDGKIVTRTKFPEGTKLVLQVEEPVPAVELDAEDERAIDRALASVREGKGISLDKFRAILQRL